MSLHTNLASLSKKPAAIAIMARLGDYALGISGNGKINPTRSIKFRRWLQFVEPCVECQQCAAQPPHLMYSDLMAMSQISSAA
jgi:hypothetical protein